MGQQCCHLQQPSRHASLASPHKEALSDEWLDTSDTHQTSTATPSTTTATNQDQCWEINRSDLEFIKMTGRANLGASWKAHIWSGKWRGSVEVEIKTVEVSKKDTRKFLEELEIIRYLHHPNLLSLVGVCNGSGEVHVVTKRPLHIFHVQHWLLRGGQVCLPLHLHILAQVASVMSYLEERDLLYLELSARHVLMSSDLVCKLEVCGFVRRSQDVSVEDAPLPWGCMCPEVASSGCVSIKTNVWLFGVFMLEVLKGGQLHFLDYMREEDVMKQVKKGQGFPPPDHCPQHLHKLMKKCWVLNPEKRPTFASLRDTLQEAAAGYTEEDVKMGLQDASLF